jgi:DNA-binding NtrC family response regulator
MVKVLIADGDPKTRKRYVETFRQNYIVAFEASNCSELVREYQRVKPHITLLNYDLPENGALPTMRELLRVYKMARIVVYADELTEMKENSALQTGAFLTIQKPNDQRTLETLVDSVKLLFKLAKT